MGGEEPGYAYIWEYTVRPERVAEFEQAYGPDGEWVRLFRRAGGYVRTELHRDRANLEDVFRQLTTTADNV